MRLCKKLRILAAAAAIVVLAAACSTDDGGGEGIHIVATTTILGDVVANVAGDGAQIEALIPLGASPHDFVPSSRQVAAIHNADLVVANGLDLEEGLGDVLASAQGEGVNVLAVAPLLTPLPRSDGEGVDPHVWMDPLRMQVAAQAIAKDLFLIDGDGAWQDRADAYIEELQMTHQEIEDLLAGIPADRRKLVTNHDSLGYLAERYGFEIVGTVIPGGSSLGDPSSAALAELVETIDIEQVPAIFADTTEPDALAHAVAAEAGFTVVVVELFTGSLGAPDSGADTLIGMLLVDAERITAALAP